MSYQSGYQYSNVPANEDPLSSSNNNITNNNGNVADDQNPSNNAHLPPAPIPPQQQQQQQHVEQYTAAESAYSPRAYLASYHEYVQNNPTRCTTSPTGTNGGVQGNPNYNNAYGSEFTYSHYNSPFQYLESQRKSRRNKFIIGLCAIIFFFMITHSPSSSSKNTASTTTTTTATTTADTTANEQTIENNNKDEQSEESAEEHEENSNSGNDESSTNSNESSNNIDNNSSTNINENKPKLTLLLTYPMSGTTFTMKILEKTTDKALATNFDAFEPYRDPNDHENIRLITKDYPNLNLENDAYNYGYPFWTTSYHDDGITLPENQVVTLSHCSGYCIHPCTPDEYIHSQAAFEESCRVVDYFNKTKESYTSFMIPKEDIDSVIHVIRDPMSNVVSRFHQFLSIDNVKNNNQWNKDHAKILTQHENFRAWCHEMDTNETLVEVEQGTSHLLSKEIKRDLKKIPCHTEFLKYASWHNHVVEMIWTKDYRSLPIYFEDYENENGRIEAGEKMAHFVGYGVIENKLASLPSFYGGKKYRALYYTEEEIQLLKTFFEMVSYKRTWELLARYF